jgi:VWFA-related protein
MSTWLLRLAFLAILFLLVLSLHSQVPNPQAVQNSQKPGKTIRVNVALVQTDVMVFDRDNRFVDNLRPEQFELRVNGNPVPVDFFDMVYAGTPHDEEIWAKMDRKKSPAAAPPSPASRSNVGRTILFFVDDWHLSADSMMRTRIAVEKLIEDSVGINDQAALVTASGQLGFLQQFTDDKSVLRAAAAKLAGGSIVEDSEYPPMNEAHAARIVQRETALEGYFVDALKKKEGMSTIDARRTIQNRASRLANLSATIAERTLSSLRDFIRSTSVLPGRKLVFLLSDGFALQHAVSDIVYRLRQLTTEAANKGVVIYTLDTRGLVVGLRGAKDRLPPQGQLEAYNQSGYSAVMDFQDGLNALASDTGGRFLKNTNALDTAISTAMAEASRYYLLGWYVDADRLIPGKYWSLHVSIKDRPDLKVRLRAGQVDLSQSVPIPRTKPIKPAVSPKEAADQLLRALQAPFPIDDLPVYVHAGWILDPDQGPMVALTYQVDADAIRGAEPVSVEVASGVADKDGVVVDKFTETLSHPRGGAAQSPVDRVAFKYSRTARLGPGLYQVRVAAREPLSGSLGSAWQWLEVPAPEKGELRLSSIFLREQNGAGTGRVSLNADALSRAQFDVRRRFSARSLISFYVNVYDASSPDIEIRTTVFQGNQPVIEAPAQSISVAPATTNRNLTPVTGTLSFDGVAPGSYILQVAATDRQNNTTVIQRIPFWIR